MSEPLPPAGSSPGPAGAGWPDEPNPQAPRISPFNRIWKVLVAPQETFRAIAARPSWGLILLLTVVVVMAVWAVQAQKIDFLENMRQQFEQQGKEMPPGIEKFAGISKITTPIFTGVVVVIFLLLAALVYLAFNLFGGRLRYVTSLSVVLYAGVPNLLKLLLSLPVALSRESIQLEEAQMGLLKSSLAAFAPEDAGPRLLAVLAHLDVFELWSLILLIIGFSTAAQVSKKTATTFVLVVWAAIILLLVSLAGLRPS